MSSFPFDAQFQRKIVKMALSDDGFCTMALRYITAPMFESDALRWFWQQIQKERQEQRTPTPTTLRDKIRQVEVVLQPRYHAMLDAVDQEILREDQYIRHALQEFVHRNLFVAAYQDSQRIYNMGKVVEAIDLMRQEVDKIHRVTFAPPARYWFYDDLDERQRRRQNIALREWEHTFPTGIVGVDEVLDGGLAKGELGCWMADSKGGKSLFLIHLAAYTCRALQQRVVLVLLEGNYLQTASRLDAWHAQVAYREAKRGQFDYQTLQRLHHEYRAARDRLVVREMTDKAYSAADIRSEIDDLKSQFGWRPAMLVVDYGDLLRGTGKAFSEEEHQRNAFSDLKAMTSQDDGYAIWTASQARRPGDAAGKRDKDNDETYKWGKRVLGPKDMADSYNKVRRVDFLGSINQDAEDKEKGTARLYCAIYRDNVADRLVVVKQDLDRMIFADVMDPLNRPDMAAKVQAELERGRKKAEPAPPAPPPQKAGQQVLK